jgi:hypothetical protein
MCRPFVLRRSSKVVVVLISVIAVAEILEQRSAACTFTSITPSDMSASSGS